MPLISVTKGVADYVVEIIAEMKAKLHF